MNKLPAQRRRLIRSITRLDLTRSRPDDHRGITLGFTTADFEFYTFPGTEIVRVHGNSGEVRIRVAFNWRVNIAGS